MSGLVVDVATNSTSVTCGPSGTDVDASVTAPSGSRVISGGFSTDTAVTFDLYASYMKVS